MVYNSINHVCISKPELYLERLYTNIRLSLLFFSIKNENQSTSLRFIACAPPYISNHTLHSDIKIHTVYETVNISYKLIHALSSESIPGDPPRRLEWNWSGDLK